MKLSIITSLYRSEKHLPRFLKEVKEFSLKIKDFVNFELIIISNDPNELELSLLNSFKQQIPSLLIYTTDRESLYASWNRGIYHSQGDFITFWNVDDTRYYQAIIKAFEKIKNQNIHLIYFPFVYLRFLKIFSLNIPIKINIIYPPIFDKNKFINSMHCGPFFIFSKKLYEQVGVFDESFKIAGDFDWCIRAAKITEFTLINQIGGIFRNNGTSLSGSKNQEHIKENDLIYKKYNINK